jgi:hypothetical protein
VSRDRGIAEVARHPFYVRPNPLLNGHGFHWFVEKKRQHVHASVTGQQSLAPGCQTLSVFRTHFMREGLADRSSIDDVRQLMNGRQRKCVYFQHFTVGARLAPKPARNGMLRIRRTANVDVVFALSGRFDKESIAELEAVINAEGRERPIILDLKDMTLTGQDGITFFAQCEAADIALANCDPYVREWITRQRTGA